MQSAAAAGVDYEEEALRLRQQLQDTLREINEYRSLLMLDPVAVGDASDSVALWGVSGSVTLVWPTFHLPCLSVEALPDTDHELDDHRMARFRDTAHDPLSALHLDIPVHLLYTVHSLRKQLNLHGGAASIKPSSVAWLHNTARLLPNTLDVCIINSACDELNLFDSDDGDLILHTLATLQHQHAFHIRSLQLQCYDVEEHRIAAALRRFTSIEQLILPNYLPDPFIPVLMALPGLKAIRIERADERDTEAYSLAPLVASCQHLRQIEFWDARVDVLRNVLLPLCLSLLQSASVSENGTHARTLTEIKFSSERGELSLAMQRAICSYVDALKPLGWGVVEVEGEGSLLWMYGVLDILQDANSVEACVNKEVVVADERKDSACDLGGAMELVRRRPLSPTSSTVSPTLQKVDKGKGLAESIPSPSVSMQGWSMPEDILGPSSFEGMPSAWAGMEASSSNEFLAKRRGALCESHVLEEASKRRRI
ncbi:hypothetical protein BC830DRAFT_946415 [Chytriomyces sp. MP71]|nr:hypothetical protein BC830DRAFT_946415 [Chytriomyces sp. MP71]